MKLNTLLASSIISLGLLATPCLFAEDKVVATVNDAKITQAELDDFISQVQSSGRQDVNPQLALDDLIATELVRQDAKAQGLENDESIKKRLEEVREQLILDLWTKKTVEGITFSEAELKAEYDKLMEKQPKTEYKARHILVKTEDEANAIIKELEGDKDFAKLAEEKSTGPSGPRGGDLGWFKATSMVPPFAEAVAAMKPNEISKTPVKTQFGFHVIKLEDKRNAKLPELDGVKPQLERTIRQRKLTDLLNELKAKAKITTNLPTEATVADTKIAAPAADDKAAEAKPVEEKAPEAKPAEEKAAEAAPAPEKE